MSQHEARVRWRDNGGYDPPDDTFIRCGVCGAQNDDARTSEPVNFAGITLITTGTKYQPTVGGNYDDVDLQVEPRTTKYHGCWFCGSGNWRGASGPEGLR